MAKTYYAVGQNSKFYKSIDDGNTWSVSTLPVTGTYAGVHFIDANTGWVCGYNDSLVGNLAPIILKTINGGTSWTQQTTPIIDLDIGTGDRDYHLYDILFINSNEGYCSGWIARDGNNDDGFGALLKTVDSGLTWTEIPLISNGWGGSIIVVRKILIDVSDSTILLFCALDYHPNYIIIYRQNGNIQTLLNNGLLTGNYSCYQAKMISNGNLKLAQFGGRIGRSSDDGATIVESDIDLTTNCRAIDFTAENIGHIGAENGKMFRFNDSSTPSEQTYAGNSVLWINMENEISGIAVGSNGEIYKYQL